MNKLINKLFCNKIIHDKKKIISIGKYLKCPISSNPLEVNKEGNLQMDYIVYKKVNNVYILVEEKAEIML